MSARPAWARSHHPLPSHRHIVQPIRAIMFEGDRQGGRAGACHRADERGYAGSGRGGAAHEPPRADGEDFPTSRTRRCRTSIRATSQTPTRYRGDGAYYLEYRASATWRLPIAGGGGGEAYRGAPRLPPSPRRAGGDDLTRNATSDNLGATLGLGHAAGRPRGDTEMEPTRPWSRGTCCASTGELAYVPDDARGCWSGRATRCSPAARSARRRARVERAVTQPGRRLVAAGTRPAPSCSSTGAQASANAGLHGARAGLYAWTAHKATPDRISACCTGVELPAMPPFPGAGTDRQVARRGSHADTREFDARTSPSPSRRVCAASPPRPLGMRPWGPLARRRRLAVERLRGVDGRPSRPALPGLRGIALFALDGPRTTGREPRREGVCVAPTRVSAQC